MPVTLGTNIASLQAQRQLLRSSEQLGQVFERLSSGQRINRASDDAAGLAIADDLNARARVYTQGIRNLNDGVSLFNIADSGLDNLTNILIRLEELAEQSANGVYGPEQRAAIDVEAQELKAEFFRISKTTEFNGQQIFSGELDQLNLQGGIGDDAVLSLGIGGGIGTGGFVTDSTSLSTEGTTSNAVALGDLNGDGVLDLVTAGQSGGADGYVTVQLGTGSGSFGASVSFQAESLRSNAVALGDINGDGMLDLVTAGQSDGINGITTVRLGDGTGSFSDATSYQYGLVFNDVTLGDLNGDGILDLIAVGANGASGTAMVRLGDGTGAFGSRLTYNTESNSSYGVSLGDLNGDGILDLATAGGNAINGYATVRLGDGTGAFGTATSLQAETSNSNDITLGDLNGDGILDLVTAGTDGPSSGFATVRLGDGTGSFGDATSFTMASFNSFGVSLGDLNGDGFLDLVTAGLSGAGGFASARLGDGAGSFADYTSYQTESTASSDVTLGDLNSDGILDLVTAGSTVGGNGNATIRLGDSIDGVAPLVDFSLRTMADARQALPVFKKRREGLTAQRGEIGSNQSRLDVATRVLDVSRENFTAAETRIRDADVADESANLTRLNILQQASASVLAQANQQPALALQLLG